MKELSLHILDIVQNSITAKATLVDITIVESTVENTLRIKITDNGIGMSQDLLNKVVSPFVTTRNTRKIGLGISLFKAAAERCNGGFSIDSEEGKGTIIEAVFERSHIDRAPLGSMADTLIVLIISENVDFIYHHFFNSNELLIDTREIKKILGNQVSISDPQVLEWIKSYVLDSTKELYNKPES